MTSDDEIYRAAIAHYGEPAQVLKAIEEIAELGKQLCLAIKSGNDKRDTHLVHMCSLFINIDGIARSPDLVDCVEMDNHPVIEHLLSECADVENMLNQLRIMFGPWDEEKKMKNERLMERIKNESPR